MAWEWSWSKLSLDNLKNVINLNNNNNNNSSVKVTETVVHSPPNQTFVRACRLAFPFLVLGNFAVSGYLMAKAKQRDEAKAKQRDEAKATQGNHFIAKEWISASMVPWGYIGQGIRRSE